MWFQSVKKTSTYILVVSFGKFSGIFVKFLREHSTFTSLFISLTPQQQALKQPTKAYVQLNSLPNVKGTAKNSRKSRNSPKMWEFMSYYHLKFKAAHISVAMRFSSKVEWLLTAVGSGRHRSYRWLIGQHHYFKGVSLMVFLSYESLTNALMLTFIS